MAQVQKSGMIMTGVTFAGEIPTLTTDADNPEMVI